MNTLINQNLFFALSAKKYKLFIELQRLGVRNSDGNSLSILKK